MAPIVHGLEAQYQDRMRFIYLDIDDSANQTYKKELGFRYQPHIFLLDAEGNVLSQWVGPVSKDDLETAILEALE
jgi:hypothetical protein